MYVVRPALPVETTPLARLWKAGWHEAHAALLPAELVRQRTLSYFEGRLASLLADARTIGAVGAGVGLCVVQGDEVSQMYVEPVARGSGVAAALLTDAELRIAANGARVAWLACAIGNERAARFYAKSGWRCMGTIPHTTHTDEGLFHLTVWRFEKQVGS